MVYTRFALSLVGLLLFILAQSYVDALNADQTFAQSLPTQTVTRAATATSRTTTTPSPSATLSVAPLRLFATPRPIQTEEPLTSGFQNIPRVFEGIDAYDAIRAQLSFTNDEHAHVTTLRDAIASVVQIFRCDQFGCDTPVGSGTIIHQSGLILTAYHVLLEDPNDLTSRRYQDFVVALASDVRSAPQPRYKASVAGEKNEQDIAVLTIDRTLEDELIEPGMLQLPTLSFAEVDLLFADTLHVLGYPLQGGEAINYSPTTFASFDDDGQLIVVSQSLRQGNSGGPALVTQNGELVIAGLVIRGRSTLGQPERNGILRTIDQVASLNWTPRAARALLQDLAADTHTSDSEQLLEITGNLMTLDLVHENLRLLLYVVDRETRMPFQSGDTAGSLVIWADFSPESVIDSRGIHLEIPIDALSVNLDDVAFYGMLWHRQADRALWASMEPFALNPAGVVPRNDTMPAQEEVTPEPTLATIDRQMAETATASPTLSATRTTSAIAAPTVDAQATSDAVNTAVAIALTALASPESTETPTADLVARQLTAIAVETVTAMANLPTPTFTPVPIPTATAVPIPTATADDCSVTGVYQVIWQNYRQRLGCNVGGVAEDVVTYQPFAGGYLLWLKSADAIYYLAYGKQWARYENQWHEGDPPYSCPEAERVGNPQMGFGRLWCSLEPVRTSLGQAIGAERALNPSHRQRFEQGVVFDIVGGTVVLFDNGAWLEE